MIEITLNGKRHTVTPGTTVASLLTDLGLERRRVAVERNTEIVPRATYEQVELAAGDHVEVVTFVGGG
jgi:thiamine biosynthesis protein ThiS